MIKKIIVSVFIATLFIGCCIAQPPTAGSYIVNNNVDKFIGTWKWTSGSDEIVFKLGKFRHTVVDYDEDVLLGTHSYVQNGQLIESTLNRFDNLSNRHKDRSIYLSNDPIISINRVQGALKDVSKNKDVEIVVEYVLGASPEQIIVSLSYKHQTLTKDNQYSGITLPLSFIMTKQ